MGRFLFNKRTPESLKKGLKHYERAIELDSRFALAYVGLFECYTYLGFYHLLPNADVIPKAREMALRAIKLDPHLAEAHTAMAHIKLWEWDWTGMEEEYRCALKINPNLPRVHQLYSVLLRQMGRFDECFAEIRKSQELDPISPTILVTAAANFYCARQYDTALEEILKVLELEPAMPSGHFVAGWIYTQQGKYTEAVEAFQKAGSLFEYDNPEIKAHLACAYALSGRTKKARQLLNQLHARSQQKEIQSYHIALVYAALGDRDQAFAYLWKGFEERSAELSYLKVDPLLDGLRADARFADLLRQVGFTD
jgi:tetratricopeptide (TPR) repeat protein